MRKYDGQYAREIVEEYKTYLKAMTEELGRIPYGRVFDHAVRMVEGVEMLKEIWEEIAMTLANEWRDGK